jgi:hypothetical protein
LKTRNDHKKKHSACLPFGKQMAKAPKKQTGSKSTDHRDLKSAEWFALATLKLSQWT